jgi:hypothetical protein
MSDTCESGKLSYMALAMEREQSTCRSLLPRARAVLADPEPMLSRLVRGCIALAFTACVPALLACTISLIPSRAASGLPARCNASELLTDLY